MAHLQIMSTTMRDQISNGFLVGCRNGKSRDMQSVSVRVLKVMCHCKMPLHIIFGLRADRITQTGGNMQTTADGNVYICILCRATSVRFEKRNATK